MDASEARPTHLGSVVSINSSIMMVLGDAEIAATWQGTTNHVDSDDAVPDLEDGDSDWAQCLRALLGAGGLPFARVPCSGGELLTIMIASGGYVEVFRAGERLVLVEACWSELGHLTDRDFLDYVSNPCSEDATDAGFVEVQTGSIAFLPSPSSGTSISGALANLVPDGSAQFSTEECETAVVVQLPAGRYRVRVEGEVKRAWGDGARAVVELEPALQG
ncbi:hypothetical protein GCM10015535_61260 [Streptomyces gelaticus]|uniref:Uncharacterized protein n=1 Tax=Streptomyces gelaticus TaxID=285446 RepID=A0ABQ2W7T1_9ACTN|nr:hypothetical protein [Streptomyces gelaticus]GGV94898.1 hypothetical protein GCM10015535_61260 [Streptomyces gelaticus]